MRVAIAIRQTFDIKIDGATMDTRLQPEELKYEGSIDELEGTIDRGGASKWETDGPNAHGR